MYFKTKDKTVVEAINSVIENRTKYGEGILKLVQDFSADKAGVFGGGRLGGFLFVNRLPEGWRKPQGSDGYTWPLKRNKDAWEKIKALPILSSTGIIAKTINFSEQFEPRKGNGLSSLIRCPACFTHNQIAYFQVDDGLSFEPPEHFVEILASEYQKANKPDATGHAKQ